MAGADRFLDAVSAGPAALVLEGESGIGKTTIRRARHARGPSRRLVRDARGAGVRRRAVARCAVGRRRSFRGAPADRGAARTPGVDARRRLEHPRARSWLPRGGPPPTAAPGYEL